MTTNTLRVVRGNPEPFNAYANNKNIVAKIYKENSKISDNFPIVPLAQDTNNGMYYTYVNPFVGTLFPAVAENCLGGVATFWLSLNGFLTVGDTWNFKENGDDLIKYLEVQDAFGIWSSVFMVEMLVGIDGRQDIPQESNDPGYMLSEEVNGKLIKRVTKQKWDGLFGVNGKIWNKLQDGTPATAENDPYGALCCAAWVQAIIDKLCTLMTTLTDRDVYVGGEYQVSGSNAPSTKGGVNVQGWFIGLMLYHTFKVVCSNPHLDTSDTLKPHLDKPITINNYIQLGFDQEKTTLYEWNQGAWDHWDNNDPPNSDAQRFWIFYYVAVSALSNLSGKLHDVPEGQADHFFGRRNFSRRLPFSGELYNDGALTNDLPTISDLFNRM
jgi:hypothetical protein